MKQGQGRKTVVQDSTKNSTREDQVATLCDVTHWFVNGLVKHQIKDIHLAQTIHFVTIAGVHFHTLWYTKRSRFAFIIILYKLPVTRILGWEKHWLFTWVLMIESNQCFGPFTNKEIITQYFHLQLSVILGWIAARGAFHGRGGFFSTRPVPPQVKTIDPTQNHRWMLFCPAQ